MDSTDKVFVIMYICLTTIAVIAITCFTVYEMKLNIEIAKETSCEGKVILQSFSNDDAKVLALKQCGELQQGMV